MATAAASPGFSVDSVCEEKEGGNVEQGASSEEAREAQNGEGRQWPWRPSSATGRRTGKKKSAKEREMREKRGRATSRCFKGVIPAFGGK
jgi:hypothetical protein